MNSYEFKTNIIERLKSRNIFTQQVSDDQIRTRCPYCGDSQKNINTGHLYIKIDTRDNSPMVYYCHKCPASGILTYNDLELLGLEGDELKSGIHELNKNSPSKPIKKADKYFEFKLPDTYDKNKIQYMENRLGYNFTIDELKDIKVITSLKHFMLLNKINTITCKPNLARLFEKDYIGFLSTNNSHILFRDITNTHDISWFKYPIYNESHNQRVMYSVMSSIDLYTDDIITINLSEGVMDCLSIAYNINSTNDNTLNIAVCGKYYNAIIENLLTMGFIGDNIVINVYSDNDKTTDTSIEWYRKMFKEYNYLVKEINVYYNLLSKDCGVPPTKIKLKKYSV